MRVGLGYDIHRLVKGRKLFLGGVEIPFHKGLLGHSDGDVILHAVSDALLGAMGKGDIGELFPPTNARYKGMASSKMLSRVFGLLKQHKSKIANLDITLIAEEPKIDIYKKKIKKSIAKTLGMDLAKINLKATTNEGVGLIGKKEAIACFALAVLE